MSMLMDDLAELLKRTAERGLFDALRTLLKDLADHRTAIKAAAEMTHLSGTPWNIIRLDTASAGQIISDMARHEGIDSRPVGRWLVYPASAEKAIYKAVWSYEQKERARKDYKSEKKGTRRMVKLEVGGEHPKEAAEELAKAMKAKGFDAAAIDGAVVIEEKGVPAAIAAIEKATGMKPKVVERDSDKEKEVPNPAQGEEKKLEAEKKADGRRSEPATERQVAAVERAAESGAISVDELAAFKENPTKGAANDLLNAHPEVAGKLDLYDPNADAEPVDDLSETMCDTSKGVYDKRKADEKAAEKETGAPAAKSPEADTPTIGD